MPITKILINFDEYQSLKAYKEKYIHLKQSSSDQIGHGSNYNAELDKIVRTNENSDAIEKPQQTILESNTVPQPVKDIDSEVQASQSVPQTSVNSNKNGEKIK